MVLLVQVHFNLQLSEKERFEKEKVVLPFEHQGEFVHHRQDNFKLINV